MIYPDSFDIPVVVLHRDNHEVIIMRGNFDGITTRKGDVDSQFSCSLIQNLWDITFEINTYLTSFLYKQLERPPSEKPLVMVLTLYCRVFSPSLEEDGNDVNKEGVA